MNPDQAAPTVCNLENHQVHQRNKFLKIALIGTNAVSSVFIFQTAPPPLYFEDAPIL